MSVSLSFHGAAGTVTGSCHRLVTPHGSLLIDCGMFQGQKSLRSLNYRPFPFSPHDMGAVILTHAHIDHSGLFPKLALAGFRGHAWMTRPTQDLLRWLLADAAAIQENDVDRLNRRNARRGEGQVTAIYTRADAEAALELTSTVGYERWFEPLRGVRARLRNAGHILGSAFVELEIDAAPRPLRMVFSGDIGPAGKPLQPDATLPEPADIAVMEATYGDTVRERVSEAERRARLGEELTQALKAGGNVLVPVFAVERTQEILEDIALLKEAGALPAAPVFLDSPLAGRTTEVFRRYSGVLERSESGEPFSGGDFRMMETVEQSKSLARIHGGAIILAGSGMCDAGRIKHHLKDHLWRSDSTVLFVGYQAPGTLGALIRGGAPRVRIHGEEIEVKARIRSLDVYSGHADRDELIAWTGPLRQSLGTVLLVHGEGPALAGLADGLAARGLPRERIAVPTLDQEFAIVPRDGRWVAEPGPEPVRRLAPADAVASRDWHNDYAETLLDLRAALRRAPDDRSRRRLLSELRRLLAAKGP